MRRSTDTLSVLGLGDYESRVYCALLADHPATGYRIGRTSGVPLSKVYEVLERLAAKGAAARLPGDPARFEPTPPSRLVAESRARAARDLDDLESSLALLYSGGAPAPTELHRTEEAVTRALENLLLTRAGAVRVLAGRDAKRTVDLLVSRVDNLVPVSIVLEDSGDTWSITVTTGGTALVGQLGPHPQCVVTELPAVLEAAAARFREREAAAHRSGLAPAAGQRSVPPPEIPQIWLTWEEQKQRRLLASLRSTHH